MIFNVLIPIAAAGGFDYRVPEGMEVSPGDYVRVPFGKKSALGVVWGAASGEVEEKKIRSVESMVADIPPMRKPMRAFIDWVAWYTISPPGMVLKMAFGGQGSGVGDQGSGVGGRGSGKEAASDKRAECLSAPPAPRPPTPDPRPLTPDQQSAADTLRGKLDTGFSVTVVDGVTGSGKTEVYFDAIAACIAAGKQALVLLPEIALSVQWLKRFESRFGFAPHVWHSGITPARKRRAWRQFALGEAGVVVGARSALFLPFHHLGLIVVDEEHDGSYKQEDGVIYHARDMAVARARHEAIAAMLVSATPSLETETNIRRGRYARVHLPARHFGASMPAVRLIDMRQEKLPATRWLCEPLKEALIRTVAEKRQSMLFINRRGYAPLLLCRACGHRFQCPDCSTALVLHQARKALICHHCGHRAPVPKACPACKAEGTFAACGPGVERVAEEVRALLPDARVAVMTSDSTGFGVQDSGFRKETSPESLINAMTAGEIDILIGTQMIAKGHHFAHLALVGVVDADMGLNGGDLRAGERTYQLLHQLSGRAGRESTKGLVLLQTYQPDHPVMQALKGGDRDRFMRAESAMREEARMPPFGKLAAIIVEGRDERQVVEFARELVRRKDSGFRIRDSGPSTLTPESRIPNPDPLILGPAPAPLARLRGRFRWRILVKAAREFALQDWLAGWMRAHKPPAALKVRIDVDPYSFM